MGRPRTPDAAKKQNGTYRKDRATPEQESVSGEISSSQFRFTTVNSTYKLLVSVAEETGVFSKQYCFSLRVLATDLYHLAKLARIVEKDGFSYLAPNPAGGSFKKPDPDAEAYRKCVTSVRKGLAEFGWNPSSAASVAKDESDGKNKLFEALAALMGGGDLEDEFK